MKDRNRCTSVEETSTALKVCNRAAVVEFYVGGWRYVRCAQHMSPDERARAEAADIVITDLVAL